MTGKFDGKTAFITGGGRGFGEAFGRALAARGARVAQVDVDLAAAEAVAAAIRADGGEAIAIACDVADEAAVAATAARVIDGYGGIDILINNAGLHSMAYSQPLLTMGLAAIRRLYDVNLIGTIACSLACHATMKARGGGVILNLASAASYACQTAYGASKQAIRGVTLTLANDFGPDNIRVVGVAPGLMATDTIVAELPPEMWAHIAAMQSLRRRGEVADIVSAMLYLCSDDASFVTGTTLQVGGGFPLAS
ncbi:SDR family NAD(P)-dependent oxidoreductase [uncultured Sphingomonas sp.]|uniref:SDR family NAD(P)-dependent oxidoreductase n=1 Tax=uncultured Sphingomonas sp. TaxID=158754 RepID=UPI0035C9DFE2